MKRILFLCATLVAFSTTAFATTNTAEAEASTNNYVRGYGNSFIFTEGGIEFSVFADGQFDFYMPNYGPDINVGINTPGFSLSFNSGYNYNPYVQYDDFGAIIQIENTPIYYDYYGRVNQIGNIFINYTGFGRINRIGGLNVYYRNNVFYRYDGFINVYNRHYVYRPWHRYYAVPAVNYCVVNVNPYRRYYTPVRHIYYRPYRNNVRNYNIGRRDYANYGRRNNSARVSRRYAQNPRNARERSIQTRVRRNNATIASTRSARLRSNNAATSRSSSTRSRGTVSRTNTRGNSNAISNRSNNRVSRGNDRNISTRSKGRIAQNSRTPRADKATSKTRSTRSKVTRSRPNVSNKIQTRKRPSVRKPSSSKSRTYNRTKSQNSRKRTVTQSRKKASPKATRSNTSRSSKKSTSRSGSRRSRG